MPQMSPMHWIIISPIMMMSWFYMMSLMFFMHLYKMQKSYKKPINKTKYPLLKW